MVDYTKGVTLKYEGLEITIQVVEGSGTITTNFEHAETPTLVSYLLDGPPLEKKQCHCDNCAWAGTYSDLGLELNDVPHLWERLDEGSEVPAGECPACEALAYLTEVEDHRSELEAAVAFNGAIDGIESTMLAHACAGLAVGTTEYLLGVKTAVDAVSQQFS